MISGWADRGGDVRGIVSEYLPGQPLSSVVPIGEGLDNAAYEVDGNLIVRFAKEPDLLVRSARVEREARLLAAVRQISPLPVPELAFTVPEAGCLAYVKLPGSPLLDAPANQRDAHGGSIAEALGRLLVATHGLRLDQVAGLVDTDDQPLDEWRQEAADVYASIAGRIPAVYRRAVAAFLDAVPPRDTETLTFSHNDLGIEHVLVDPVTWAVTGVIDWSDAAIADPAHDVGLILRDLGPTATDAVMGVYRGLGRDAVGLRDRAVFYARCSVLEDLAYGLETGKDAYVDKSVTALEWLFGEPHAATGPGHGAQSAGRVTGPGHRAESPS